MSDQIIVCIRIDKSQIRFLELSTVLSDFNILWGNALGEMRTMYFLYKSEEGPGIEFNKVQQILKQKFEYLFELLFSIQVTVTVHTIHDKHQIHKKTLDELLVNIKPEKLSKYIRKDVNENERKLFTAFREFHNGDLENSFPKLVNWLEDNKNIQTKYCALRNCFSHKDVKDPQNVKNQFPEFEFEGDMIKTTTDNLSKLQPICEKLVQEAKNHYVKIIND